MLLSNRLVSGMSEHNAIETKERREAKNTNQGFPSILSPTIMPSAPVSSRFLTIWSHVPTLPLLTTLTPACDPPKVSFKAFTAPKSADPALLLRALTCLAWRVIQDAPFAAMRVPSSEVRVLGEQSRILALIGTEREWDSWDTIWGLAFWIGARE